MTENWSLTRAGPSAEDRWDREVANIRAGFSVRQQWREAFPERWLHLSASEFMIKHLSKGKANGLFGLVLALARQKGLA